MLKTTAQLDTAGPLATYRTRPIVAFLVWVVAGALIGVGGGFVFGLLFGLAYGAGSAVLAVGLIGSVYGLFLGVPSGVVVGLATALLRRPRPFQRLVATVRTIGFVLLGVAGVIGGVMWAPLLFAAGVGAWLGALATPFVVRVSASPVDQPAVDDARHVRELIATPVPLTPPNDASAADAQERASS